MESMLQAIRAVALEKSEREVRARKIATAIQNHGGYRWVGVYDVRDGMVSIIAWTGPSAPVFPTFPATQGLTAVAIRQKAPIVVDDVTLDDRYLTAFETTRSEIIIPLLAPGGQVVGTIDVESQLVGAFSAGDQRSLEQCAQAALPLWMADPGHHL
jgi:putative methionine-R-sulfoxide reductase with GAF domain